MRRYVTQEQRKAENEGVTEDDVNEIKNDISAFRFEMIEIMKASGMNTQGASGASGLKMCFWLRQELKESQSSSIRPFVRSSGSSLSRALNLHYLGSGDSWVFFRSFLVIS